MWGVGRREHWSWQGAGGRGQEAVFVTGIYAPLQKLFALKGEVLDPIFSINASPRRKEIGSIGGDSEKLWKEAAMRSRFAVFY